MKGIKTKIREKELNPLQNNFYWGSTVYKLL